MVLLGGPLRRLFIQTSAAHVRQSFLTGIDCFYYLPFLELLQTLMTANTVIFCHSSALEMERNT